MNQRILTLINLLLLIICAGCIYYLATATYYEPKEIRQVRGELEKIESSYEPETPITPPGDVSPYPPLNLKKTILMKELYTPTPTPEPSPSPTPEPPDLYSAVVSWQMISIIDETTVEFEETRAEEADIFIMEVGGPPRTATDKKERELEVRLLSVDLDEFTATVGFEGVEHTFEL